MPEAGADPAEVRLATLLFGKPRTTLEGGKDVPFVEVNEAVTKASSNGLLEPSEFKSILDWHAMKCTANDLLAICKMNRAADGVKVNTVQLLDRAKRIHAGTLKVTAPKVTVQELEHKVRSLLTSKFTTIFKDFVRHDDTKTGDITDEQFRAVLAKHNFVMDDETFELFCTMWMDKSSLTKLNVTGNINYEAFKRKYGGVVVAEGQDQFMSKVHDEGMRKHLEKLHARDKYTNLRFATAEQAIAVVTRLMSSRFTTVHEAFSALDTNRSGSIDSSEFQLAIEKFANLRLKDDEYERLARHFKFNLMKPLSFQDFSMAFGALITGSVQKKTMADRNEASLKAHKERQSKARDAALSNITAENAAKQFTAKLGNKFDKLRVAFNSMDLDGSGTIEPEEFRNVLLGYNLRMTDEEWQKFLKGYPRDSAGRIRREDFYKKFGPLLSGSYGTGGPGESTNANERARMLQKVQKNIKTATVTADVAAKKLREIIASKYDDIRKAFVTMDRDNSGEIEAAEFRRALEQFNLTMNDEEFSKFVSKHGLGDNQTINFGKFQKKFGKLIIGTHGDSGGGNAKRKDTPKKKSSSSSSSSSPSSPAPTGGATTPPQKASPAAVPAPKQSPTPQANQPAKAKAGPPAAAAAAVKASPPAPAKKPQRFMSLLDAIARLETLLGKKARKLPAALIAMDLEATSCLKPDECRRVFAQFGINITAKDFRQLCKLYDCWAEDNTLCNYVVLARGFGADLAQRVYDVSPMKKAANAKVVADARIALKEGQEYLLDKLRNSYEKVVTAMHFADTQEHGYITDEDFVSILARHGGVRLTKQELSAFCDFYNKPSTRFDNQASTHIDYKKFSKLFDPLRHPVDYSDPTVMKKFKAQNEEAEAYLRDKLRNAYPKVLRAFKALMDVDDTQKSAPGQSAEGESRGVAHDAFRRMLSRFGAVRMTNQEWNGFISKYDTDRDGYISFDELKALFKDFTARDHAARQKAANARAAVVAERNNRRERAREVEQKLIGPAVPVEGAEDVLALHFQNKLSNVAKTIKLLDRAGDGMLPRSDFQRAVARTGLQLTTREMDALAEKYDPERKNRVNIEVFLATMRQKIAVLQANTINPVRVRRLFKSMQELLTFKFSSAEEAFKAFDKQGRGQLESAGSWAAVFDAVGMQATAQEQTALARFLDLRSDGQGVDQRAFSKFWSNLPGTPGTELARAVEAWARRSGGKTPDELLAKAKESFQMLDGQNERTLPLLEVVAAMRPVGLKFDNAESVLQPFRQGVRYNYGLLLEKIQSLLGSAAAKWSQEDVSPAAAPSSASSDSRDRASRRGRDGYSPSRGRAASAASVRSSSSSSGARLPGSRLPSAAAARSRSPTQRGRTSIDEGRPLSRVGSFPPITQRINTAVGSRPATARTLNDDKRAALEAKLRAAQLGLARKKTARGKSGSSGDAAIGPAAVAQVDFETAVFACWKKLRALFVAADKRRTGRLPEKTVVKILLRNQVGSGPDEVRMKTKPHAGDDGVNYNQFIKSVLQSKSR